MPMIKCFETICDVGMQIRLELRFKYSIFKVVFLQTFYGFFLSSILSLCHLPKFCEASVSLIILVINGMFLLLPDY